MVAGPYRRLLPSACRRLFAGLVAVYVACSLTLGGSPAAKPVLYVLALGWFSLVLILAMSRKDRRPGQPVEDPGSALLRSRLGMETIAFNIALTLALTELALRTYASWWGVSPLISDAMDAYKLKPGHVYANGLRGNRLGYPGQDFHYKKDPGRFRLAALGDSFAVGPVVPYADNYLNLLESELPGAEVYNFGVSGIGPREYVAILRRDVWRYQPDLVLVSLFVGNDITEAMATPRHLDPRQCATYLLLTRGWRLMQAWTVGKQCTPPEEAHADSGGLPEARYREIESRRLDVCLTSAPAQSRKKMGASLGLPERNWNRVPSPRRAAGSGAHSG